MTSELTAAAEEIEARSGAVAAASDLTDQHFEHLRGCASPARRIVFDDSGRARLRDLHALGLVAQYFDDFSVPNCIGYDITTFGSLALQSYDLNKQVLPNLSGRTWRVLKDGRVQMVCAVALNSGARPPPPPAPALLPSNSAARKGFPIVEGVLDYFPAAIAQMARLSALGNQKHHKGQALHWSREISSDHENCIGRHTLERGGFEIIVIDGVEHKVRHTVCRAWRALAAAQLELEAAGEAPLAITPRPPVQS